MVSERGLEPPWDIVPLGPQPGISVNTGSQPSRLDAASGRPATRRATRVVAPTVRGARRGAAVRTQSAAGFGLSLTLATPQKGGLSAMRIAEAKEKMSTVD